MIYARRSPTCLPPFQDDPLNRENRMRAVGFRFPSDICDGDMWKTPSRFFNELTAQGFVHEFAIPCCFAERRKHGPGDLVVKLEELERSLNPWSQATRRFRNPEKNDFHSNRWESTFYFTDAEDAVLARLLME